mmetsp:Transcript_53811/g.99038  ORF Transcript_53811/g.99038 Transcript_53811/m.99038 type:complete len:231 (+) Transcript_53811:84-776(+)
MQPSTSKLRRVSDRDTLSRTRSPTCSARGLESHCTQRAALLCSGSTTSHQKTTAAQKPADVQGTVSSTSSASGIAASFFPTGPSLASHSCKAWKGSVRAVEPCSSALSSSSMSSGAVAESTSSPQTAWRLKPPWRPAQTLVKSHGAQSCATIRAAPGMIRTGPAGAAYLAASRIICRAPSLIAKVSKPSTTSSLQETSGTCISQAIPGHRLTSAMNRPSRFCQARSSLTP